MGGQARGTVDFPDGRADFPDGRAGIDAALVSRLVAAQFPGGPGCP
ncbi:hypothetical protein ACQPYE_12425 [Actinosynnema sp. CA-299493]